ncbi:hypothetical protein NEOLEDRAFT_1181040 [Neolentinus lepideus HHB14362 ss-1]|uniref:Histone-lysine N-methyltransferase, H3 lysine-4 specific n=1 Tax=Neolentinus lepideus HHB14362 ss-1 TaxID=1314782 RepID=A0A165QE35_9AGAM|nr:hypothetical protein NEOLEDRAFT_1181040 [Neolentinus lepideus HHB14362 ss-1]
MSGKAPPKGPRALLNSLAAASVSSSPATAPTPVPTPSTSRLGAPPPTGPRSLTKGYASANNGFGRGRQHPNGQFPNATPPSQPTALGANSGKYTAKQNGWAQSGGVNGVHSQYTSHLTQANGRTDVGANKALSRSSIPVGPAALVNGRASWSQAQSLPSGPAALSGSRAPSHHAPPQPPSVSPPPPPPPADEPPPPPPPPTSTPPPPPSGSVPPPPPPPSAPPPLPDPSLPVPPPPPSSEPPSLPPDPPVPTASIPASRRPISLKLPNLHPTIIQPSQPSSEPPPLPPSRPPSPPPAPPPKARSLTPPPPPPSPPRPPSPPKLYSLPPPPPWPPARSEYPAGKDYKILYDPAVEKDHDRKWRNLIETVRVATSSSGESSSEPRIKGKVKGKEILYRYNGEIVDGEDEPVVRDPRKDLSMKRLPPQRSKRETFYEIKYEYDSNSTGPPPPTAVLVTNIYPLTPNQQIRRHFAVHGAIHSFEPQIDKANGSPLGIVFIKYATHEEAKKCLEKEHGKKLGIVGSALNANEGEMTVVFDGEGQKLKAVLKELDGRRKREIEEKKRKEREAKEAAGRALSSSTPNSAGATPMASAGRTPLNTQLWRSNQHQPSPQLQPPFRPQASSNPRSFSGSHPHNVRLQHPLPNTPSPQVTNHPDAQDPSSRSSKPNATPMAGAHPLSPSAPVRRPPASLVRARIMTAKATPMAAGYQSMTRFVPSPTPQSSSSTPLPSRGRTFHQLPARPNFLPQPSPSAGPSRSPSPISRRPGHAGRSARQRDREVVLEQLAKNGFDHVKLDGHGAQLSGAVREEDIQQFFEGFKVDKVLEDSTGWYVTFKTQDSARRAALVLSGRTLAHNSVNLLVQPPPAGRSAPAKTHWSDSELIDQATSMIMKELGLTLQKDVTDRVVGPKMRQTTTEVKTNRGSRISGEVVAAVPDSQRLKGLSFKKQKKRTVPPPEQPKELTKSREHEEDEGDAEKKAEALTHAEDESEVEEVRFKSTVAKKRRKNRKSVLGAESEDETDQPKKKRKTEVKKILAEDIESEDEEASPVVAHDRVPLRAVSEDTEASEPPQKRRRTDPSLDEELLSSVTAEAKKLSTEIKHLPDGEDDLIVPVATDLRARSVDSLLSSSPFEPRLSARLPSLPPDDDLCEDDEDMYFARLALSGGSDAPDLKPPDPDPSEPPPFRVHVTGSARTEGYYKISHAEKSAYVAQYAARSDATGTVQQEERTKQEHVVSSRSNRANARRRAQGLEEMNDLQRAIALSKGESAAADVTLKFNQLQSRKKQLRFARSHIHDWGLFAMERISKGDMVIEYVGEIIRAQVADKREKAYERQGIGSSYLFRIDEDLVVDATKKGNLGRLINHSCDPNCTARIITINGEKKIVIYAKQDIELGDEITYDYHFPIEQDKIPCLCGSVKCRGYLN